MSIAPFQTNFYIARLHGRAEVPSSMVYDQEGYRRLIENACYVDFVYHILTRYNCLFMGFSFVDPAIGHIFEFIKERMRSELPALHMAILPEEADTRLKESLSKFNISVVYYGNQSNDHTILWDGISRAGREFTQIEKIQKVPALFPNDTVKQFLAASYARSKLGQDLQPLRDVIIDGILAGIVSTEKKEMTPDQLATGLRRYLHMSQKEAERLAKSRPQGINWSEWAEAEGDRTRRSNSTSEVLEDDIQILVEGTIHRIRVREALGIGNGLAAIVHDCIEEILLARSWDLGAHYAGANVQDIGNILPTIVSVVQKRGVNLPVRNQDGLCRSLHDLFRHPSTAESKVLAELGRVAFGLQLVLNTPCASVAHRAVLPEIIYLDANVLMPAILEGHPYHAAYVDAIVRLDEAVKQSGTSMRVVVAEEFLNEVISHRQRAFQEVDALLLSDREELSKHVLLYGAENTNVFVSAYASRTHRTKEDISFDAFIRDVAPYDSEGELKRYLAEQGIGAIRFSFAADDDALLYHRVKHRLDDAYSIDSPSLYDRKKQVLIEHEARQLTQLALDMNQKLRSVFVTADLRLRRLAATPEFEGIAQNIVSHRGLVQLVDMLVGFRSSSLSVARLIWGGGIDEDASMIHNYYTSLALREYDEAMAMALPDVLDTLVPEMIEAARQQGLSPFASGSVEHKSHAARFVDGFEDEFYRRMAEVIRRKNPEEHNPAQLVRRRNLERKVSQIETLIADYEKRVQTTRGSKEQRSCETELLALKEQRDRFRCDLAGLR